MFTTGKRITKRNKLISRLMIVSLVVIMLSFSVYTVAVEKRSMSSKGVEWILMANKNITMGATNADRLDELLLSEDTPYKIPKILRLKSGLSMQKIADIEVYKLTPKTATNKAVIYYHGGGYINAIMLFHWRFLDKIAHETGATIYVPLYPRAPKYQFEQAYEHIMQAYKDILDKEINSEITVMGDSAGGAMSLVVSQLAHQTQLREPDKIIMISPWLDIKTDNPLIKEWDLEKKDPMLYPEFLERSAKAWAGDTDFSHPMLSPIFGEIPRSAEISLFVGGAEMLLPDCRQFYQNAKDVGIDINYFEYPKMNHVFPIYPIPEGREATNHIIDLIIK